MHNKKDLKKIEGRKPKNLFFPLFEKRKNTRIFGCNLICRQHSIIIYYSMKIRK